MPCPEADEFAENAFMNGNSFNRIRCHQNNKQECPPVSLCQGGWRASVRKPDTLPRYPIVLHRGGFPDGSRPRLPPQIPLAKPVMPSLLCACFIVFESRKAREIQFSLEKTDVHARIQAYVACHTCTVFPGLKAMREPSGDHASA